MRKAKSTEMAVLRAERFPSGNPDLGKTNAVPRCTEFDLTPAPRDTVNYSWQDSEFNHKSPKPGNCVRKDGKA